MNTPTVFSIVKLNFVQEDDSFKTLIVELFYTSGKHFYSFLNYEQFPYTPVLVIWAVFSQFLPYDELYIYFLFDKNEGLCSKLCELTLWVTVC